MDSEEIRSGVLNSPLNGLDTFWDPIILDDQSGRIEVSAMPLNNELMHNETMGMITSHELGYFVPNDDHCQDSRDGANGKKKRKDVGMEDEMMNPVGNISDFHKKEKNSRQGDSSKRSQATNNHSLAERLRRERISQRMKLLQELVPGCNKITGKAVMLDEIINYVQSLQQQVEFLSMKLATVNPEIDADIENILSNNIHHCQSSRGIKHGTISSHRFPGHSIGTISSFPGTAAPFPPLSQNLWSNELESVFQSGYESNSVANGNGLDSDFL